MKISTPTPSLPPQRGRVRVGGGSICALRDKEKGRRNRDGAKERYWDEKIETMPKKEMKLLQERRGN